MKVVVSVMNFIPAHGHNNCQIQSLLSEIDVEQGKFRWLSRGTALKLLLALRLEI